MSLPTVDPSTISEEASFRDGGMCVLCGMYIVDVAHITPEDPLIYSIRQMAPSLLDFTKDNALNMICLCPTHHSEFDSGHFVLVPSERQRQSMLEYEEHDFAMREESIAQGHGDPGRTFPKLINEFDYIPIIRSPFRFQIHNPTPHDANLFIFDNEDQRPCPLLHFQASHFSLIMRAASPLCHPLRIQSLKGDIAEPQIRRLLELYQRRPQQYSMHVISIPNEQFCDSPMYGLTPSSLASTQTENVDDDLYAGALQLLGYAKGLSITTLKPRPREVKQGP